MRVGIVGCGLMGSGIAEVCALADLDVIVVETSDDALERGQKRLATSLQRSAARRKVDDAESVLARIRFSTDLNDLADRELVIEAVAEDEAAKVAIFEQLDKIVESPDAILASNTSSIPIMRLGVATSRPEHVVGIHFFNPVPVLNLVELVPSLLTDPDVADAARDFIAGSLGKHVIVAQDRAGFIVNALLIPYTLSAVRMMESGFATADDIDQGMVRGAAHPMGPLALCDLIGLDTVKAVAESLYAEFKEPLYAPPPLLSRMVDAGLLGRKAGRGFYAYEDKK
ncbi:3-hydroxybutyryl-CoA dehydrogenase [Cryptosporangium sp. NPDC048952]|uniref:3-hydroxybutyryl-CoA dehydrogenase n=1 Tax=Cryptosporangium sp. NPDC048952 TaxID=3363961 RepID=UPI00371C9C22